MGELRETRVGIAACEPLLEWLTEVLKETAQFEVVFSTDNGLECLSAAERLKPELMILGMELREMCGVDALYEIKRKHQAPKCLMLNQYVAFFSGRLALAGGRRLLAIALHEDGVAELRGGPCSCPCFISEHTYRAGRGWHPARFLYLTRR